jgi:hypothetical protein
LSEERIKIISRVKKLREIRVDRGATYHEAATAQRLADKLEEKYSIQQEELTHVPFGFTTLRYGRRFAHEFDGSAESMMEFLERMLSEMMERGMERDFPGAFDYGNDTEWE